MELDFWDGNFSHVFFYGLLECLFTDVRCIKTFLVCIAKYIENKKIKSSKTNDIKDYQEIGEAA